MLIHCIDILNIFFSASRQYKAVLSSKKKNKRKNLLFSFIIFMCCDVQFIFDYLFYKEAMFDDVLWEIFCDFKGIENTITDTLFNICIRLNLVSK